MKREDLGISETMDLERLPVPVVVAGRRLEIAPMNVRESTLWKQAYYTVDARTGLDGFIERLKEVFDLSPKKHGETPSAEYLALSKQVDREMPTHVPDMLDLIHLAGKWAGDERAWIEDHAGEQDVVTLFLIVLALGNRLRTQAEGIAKVAFSGVGNSFANGSVDMAATTTTAAPRLDTGRSSKPSRTSRPLKSKKSGRRG